MKPFQWTDNAKKSKATKTPLLVWVCLGVFLLSARVPAAEAGGRSAGRYSRPWQRVYSWSDVSRRRLNSSNHRAARRSFAQRYGLYTPWYAVPPGGYFSFRYYFRPWYAVPPSYWYLRPWAVRPYAPYYYWSEPAPYVPSIVLPPGTVWTPALGWTPGWSALLEPVPEPPQTSGRRQKGKRRTHSSQSE